jgi:hypothetical protein
VETAHVASEQNDSRETRQNVSDIKVPESGNPAPHTQAVAIRFVSNPPGANVRIDGRSNPAWTTPITIPDLTPGTHQVVFARTGYTTESRSLEIGPKNDTYAIDLIPVATAISAFSDPPGASIDLDGAATGQVTPAQIPVSPGEHIITMRLAGYRPAQSRIVIEAGQIGNVPQRLISLNADVARASEAGPRAVDSNIPAGMGVVDLVTNPSGADIFIQGHRANRTTPAHNFFPPGDYLIELRLAGYKPAQQIVHVDAGKPSHVNINLDPQ